MNYKQKLQEYGINQNNVATFKVLKGVFRHLHNHLLPLACWSMFLESTNCAGMCTNLCKIPSQEFIKSSFGVPFNMVPNYEDMSCDMIFGQNPPTLQDDPAFKQPCYKLCKYLQHPFKSQLHLLKSIGRVKWVMT
uniref:Beta-carotene isomerase D27-like C-terminal domain-containing protein n=1 Tax=Lactuca sativa TaxID=4236 RepID=A0A9R1URE1_LACSA|nr:hypothetical protein LSAT_V11C800426200 [Lactuca sativa]